MAEYEARLKRAFLLLPSMHEMIFAAFAGCAVHRQLILFSLGEKLSYFLLPFLV